MKITIEPTDKASRSDHGVGRVWVGATDQGTPVRALVSGMRAGSDDPAVAEQFAREYAAIIEEMPPVCPDCGQPMEKHVPVAEVAEVGELALDMHEVAARWLMAFSEGRMQVPEGASPAVVAGKLRSTLLAVDPAYYADLMKAANAVTMYLIEEMMKAQGIERIDGLLGRQVAGHA